MPSTLNFRAPRLSILAGDEVALTQAEALERAMGRAMARGRQSVRPAVYEGRIVYWLVQDVRTVAPRPEPQAAEQVGPPWAVAS